MLCNMDVQATLQKEYAMGHQRAVPGRVVVFTAVRPVPPPAAIRQHPVVQRQVQPGAPRPVSVAVPAAFKVAPGLTRPPASPLSGRLQAKQAPSSAPGKIQASWAAIAAAAPAHPPPVLAAPVVAAAPVAVIPVAADLTTSHAARSHFGDLRANPDGLPTTEGTLKAYVIAHWNDFDPQGNNFILELGYQSTRTAGGGTANRLWSIIVDDHHIFHYGPSGG